MRIRPLHKTPAGQWLSDDGEWLLCKRVYCVEEPGWYAYQKLGTRFYQDTPYFYYSHGTLRSLIKGLEKARKSLNRKKNND
jgi:hypothetical protein